MVSSEDSLNSTKPAVAIESVKYIGMRMKALAEVVSVKFHIRLRNCLIDKSLCDRYIHLKVVMDNADPTLAMAALAWSTARARKQSSVAIDFDISLNSSDDSSRNAAFRSSEIASSISIVSTSAQALEAPLRSWLVNQYKTPRPCWDRHRPI